ncbi:MAG: TIGR01212 family radical SAM protein [Bacillota bacterium]|nr:TIGR01212 family radical SAM protein [Bacillota bacterium]
MFNGLHYNSIATTLKEQFGVRIVKISLDGGFTCPNRDGKVGFGGCSFCTGDGAGEFASSNLDSIKAQIEKQKSKWPDECKYIAYFQAFSNTYAPVDVLKSKWFEALSFENVVGIAIATRPDCLSKDVLNLLDELNKKTFLWVELGLQTSNEETAKQFNRCYDNSVFEEAMTNLSNLGIKTVIHMILGLPGESNEDMINTGKYVASFNPFGIKIHMLNVLNGSRLGDEYIKTPENKRMHLLSKEEYIQIVCDILEIMPPSVTIHRLTGDGPKDKLIGPSWVLDKHAVLNDIQKEFSRRGTYQGYNLSQNI